MPAIERAVNAVGAALQRWADYFVEAVLRDVVESLRPHRLGPVEISDATVDQVFVALGRSPEVARSTLVSTFRAVDKASSDDLRVMGVATDQVVEGAPRLQREWLRQSTDLIRAQEDVRRRVERVISDPVTSGRSVDDIRKLLQEQVGYSRSRAELTARDQTLKLYGRIQEQRQTAAGFTHYVWTTSLDERVREDHAALDGKVFAWDDPPIVDTRTGRRAHPGFDFACRCSAVPVPNDAPSVEEQENSGLSLGAIAGLVAAEQFVAGFAYEAVRGTAAAVEVSARVVTAAESSALGIEGVLEEAERGLTPRALPVGARPPLQLTEGAPRTWEQQIEAFRRQGETALEGRPASLSEREPLRAWTPPRTLIAREPLIRRPAVPAQPRARIEVQKPVLKEREVPKWVRGNTRNYLSWLIDNPGASLSDLQRAFGGRQLHGVVDRLVDRGVVFRGKARDGSVSWAKGLFVEQRFIGKAGIDDSVDARRPLR
jgi:SPP1 gp7 family putative phage head morphogenesis protein